MDLTPLIFELDDIISLPDLNGNQEDMSFWDFCDYQKNSSTFHRYSRRHGQMIKIDVHHDSMGRMKSNIRFKDTKDEEIQISVKKHKKN